MSKKFKVGQRVRDTFCERDGKIESIDPVMGDVEIRLDGDKYAHCVAQQYLVDLEPIAEIDARSVVDVTRRTVSKTVEEEVVEYPEFPRGTVVEDRNGGIYRHCVAAGIEKWWERTGDASMFYNHDLAWPVTVVRYGPGKKTAK